MMRPEKTPPERNRSPHGAPAATHARLDDVLAAQLAACDQAGLRRRLVVTDHAGPYALRGGRRLLNLSSNNYLGLADHPALKEAAREAAERYGTGAGASRLVTGHLPLAAELEEAVARWKGTEAAVVFTSGYAANVGVIPALVGRGDVVFSDRLNHASIVDGIVLSRAHHVRYRHNDVEHLEHLLKKAPREARKLIVTDAVFSMDGDAAPLEDLVALKERYGAWLMVDEAHSAGLLGPRGAGLVAALGLTEAVEVQMGTFSKALGSLGAYVAGSRTLIDWLVQRARSLVYSTGLPPAVLAASLAGLRLAQEEPWRREKALDLAARFRAALRAAGLAVGEGPSAIVPLIVGTSAAALAVSRALEEQGILAVAIRPPTVPEGTARLRFSFSALHDKGDVDRAARVAIDAVRALGGPLA